MGLHSCSCIIGVRTPAWRFAERTGKMTWENHFKITIDAFVSQGRTASQVQSALIAGLMPSAQPSGWHFLTAFWRLIFFASCGRTLSGAMVGIWSGRFWSVGAFNLLLCDCALVLSSALAFPPIGCFPFCFVWADELTLPQACCLGCLATSWRGRSIWILTRLVALPRRMGLCGGKNLA